MLSESSFDVDYESPTDYYAGSYNKTEEHFKVYNGVGMSVKSDTNYGSILKVLTYYTS